MRAVSQPYEFAAHDRHAPRSRFSHLYEKGRGIRKGWPDTELVLPWLTFRCELKWPPNKPDDDQVALIARLQSFPNHACAWADSVVAYGSRALDAGVELHGNWRAIATHEDELVAAEIRKQEAKRGKTPAKPRTARPTQAQVRRAEAARMLPK